MSQVAMAHSIVSVAIRSDDNWERLHAMDDKDDDPRASQQFVRMASAFLDAVAPNFQCSVCKSETFEVVEKLKGDYYPFIYSINYDTNHKKRYRQWLLVCSKCGCTYSFGREPMLAWAEARGMTGDA